MPLDAWPSFLSLMIKSKKKNKSRPWQQCRSGRTRCTRTPRQSPSSPCQASTRAWRPLPPRPKTWNQNLVSSTKSTPHCQAHAPAPTQCRHRQRARCDGLGRHDCWVLGRSDHRVKCKCLPKLQIGVVAVRRRCKVEHARILSPVHCRVSTCVARRLKWRVVERRWYFASWNVPAMFKFVWLGAVVNEPDLGVNGVQRKVK